MRALTDQDLGQAENCLTRAAYYPENVLEGRTPLKPTPEVVEMCTAALKAAEDAYAAMRRMDVHLLGLNAAERRMGEM